MVRRPRYGIVDHYNKGGVQNPFLDGGIVPLGLSEPEIDESGRVSFSLDEPAIRQGSPRRNTIASSVRSRTDRTAARHGGGDGTQGA